TDDRGRRCAETRSLEVHHRQAYALAGRTRRRTSSFDALRTISWRPSKTLAERTWIAGAAKRRPAAPARHNRVEGPRPRPLAGSAGSEPLRDGEARGGRRELAAGRPGVHDRVEQLGVGALGGQ